MTVVECYRDDSGVVQAAILGDAQAVTSEMMRTAYERLVNLERKEFGLPPAFLILSDDIDEM